MQRENQTAAGNTVSHSAARCKIWHNVSEEKTVARGFSLITVGDTMKSALCQDGSWIWRAARTQAVSAFCKTPKTQVFSCKKYSQKTIDSKFVTKFDLKDVSFWITSLYNAKMNFQS